MKFEVLVFLQLMYFTRNIFGQYNYTDRVNNYVMFISMYTPADNISATELIPKESMTTAITVSMSMVLHALFDFDEVAGSLEMSASLKLSWYDEMVQIYYGTSDYGSVYTLSSNASTNTNTLLVSYNKMWTPRLVLGNAIEEFSRIGDTAYMCRYDLTSGLVTWQPKFLLKSTCTADVTYYPFDKQHCSFTILPWGYTPTEVLINSTQSNWDLSVYEGNGEWEVEETTSMSYASRSRSVLELSLTLKRNPLWFAFNIIVPVLALSVLNGAVFWLPVDSGERVGFSITCFLTFMVLLTTVLGYLPVTSSNMSYLCYYVVVMMLFSGLLTAFVILNLHIYHKEEQESIPDCLKKFIRFWRFRWLTGIFKRKRQDGDIGDIDKSTSGGETHVPETPEKEAKHGKPNTVVCEEILKKLENKSSVSKAWQDTGDHSSGNDDPVKWKELSKFLDKFFFITFLSIEAFFSITFLVPLAYGK